MGLVTTSLSKEILGFLNRVFDYVLMIPDIFEKTFVWLKSLSSNVTDILDVRNTWLNSLSSTVKKF
jgi:hypothetical protein